MSAPTSVQCSVWKPVCFMSIRNGALSAIFPTRPKQVHNLKQNTIDTTATGGSLQATFAPGRNQQWVTGLEIVHETTDSDESQQIFSTTNESLKKLLTFQPFARRRT